ncbi:GNAT family N-acetyltransferase [Pantoea sp. EA-12]|uniref:GNAT family N-acetyltransferase n=1 Tax=Pantoea sp. EA-12 TaxID=3043303 RepID=UPI0024B53729|nr:GNAT family N-acetyltransferase [Pantoea sp. EA-12]MDI9219642.1 GNAT family N-acetyltransferase [Pantoea sp. EA-12]
MNVLNIEVSDSITPEFALPIESGLNQYNDEAVGFNENKPLAVVVRDEHGVVLGGMLGRTYLGLLFIDLVYLPPEIRGKGIGSQILKCVEDEGRERGCKTAVLYTITFQAPAFYEKNGWQRFGEIPCLPEGTSRVFLRKDL